MSRHKLAIKRKIIQLINQSPSKAIMSKLISDGYGGYLDKELTSITVTGRLNKQVSRVSNNSDNGLVKSINNITFYCLIDDDTKTMTIDDELNINNQLYTVNQIIDVDDLNVFYEVILFEK